MGFSLNELLIVVAIILIVAAIAIPNLIRAKIAANQASAADSLRTLDSTATAYYNTYNVRSFRIKGDSLLTTAWVREPISFVIGSRDTSSNLPVVR